MVIVVMEEKCLGCSQTLSGTIEWESDRSRTTEDFDEAHHIDVRATDVDRVLRGLSVSGTCKTCGEPFSYRVITVMQLIPKPEDSPG